MLGKLIVFEGVDGSGKGTQLQLTASWLKSVLGDDQVVLTKDPGGTAFGLGVRKLMYEGVPMSAMAPGVIDLMFLSTHIQNWHEVVGPSLDTGKVVLCDRWWYSQMAYQTERHVPVPIRSAYKECRAKNADVLLFLAVDVDVALNRARLRESETHQSAKIWNDLEVQKRVQAQYFRLFSTLPEWRPVFVPPDATIEDVFHHVRAMLAKELDL